jgi:hypothetical protein
MYSKELLETFIKTKSLEIKNVFELVAIHGVKQFYSFSIDCDKLNPRYANEINITKEGDYVEMFNQLQEFEEFPALYLFEIDSSIDYNNIMATIEETIQSTNLHFPANNKNLQNSGILYIGKVKSCAWGRLIQHLGYHKNKNSHGLQIDFWAKKITQPLHLKFTVMFFEKEAANYVEILETALAEKFKPIIGKH